MFVNIDLEYFWNDPQETGHSGYIQGGKWGARKQGWERDFLFTVCLFVPLNLVLMDTYYLF